MDGCITCPWHGYQYRPESGSSPPPFNDVVPTYSLRVESGRVLVDPRSTDDLARGIAAVWCDEALRRRLAERGLARAAQFTWERAARATAVVYAAALA